MKQKGSKTQRAMDLGLGLEFPDETKIVINGDDQDTNAMITRAVELSCLEFLGEVTYFKDINSAQKYTSILHKLTLCDMCDIDRYICIFQNYYYRTDAKERGTYLQMFFSIIPIPWSKKLREEYNPSTKDMLGKRICYALGKLSKWHEKIVFIEKLIN